MAHRYFTADINGGAARITGPDATHLARVLRVRPGQALTLCDGAGTDYEARVVAARPDEIELEVLSSRPSAAEPSVWCEVFIGMARGERMDWAVQKSVELGASAIRPFYSQNSVAKQKPGQDKTERYARIAAEAAKQCGRGILPAVYPATGFDEAVCAALEAADRALFLHEKGGAGLAGAIPGAGRLALITGPEGGFTPEEAAAAAGAGCVQVCLGPRILRCETAPLAALAAVMALTGNLA